MRSSISVLLSCKHSLMPSRISSNSFIIPAWANVCSSGGSNGTRPSMTARRAQLHPSDPVTLVLALAPMKETQIFSEEKNPFTYLWRRLQCWLLKDFPLTIKGSNRRWVVYGRFKVLRTALFHSTFSWLTCYPYKSHVWHPLKEQQ